MPSQPAFPLNPTGTEEVVIDVCILTLKFSNIFSHEKPGKTIHHWQSPERQTEWFAYFV